MPIIDREPIIGRSPSELRMTSPFEHLPKLPTSEPLRVRRRPRLFVIKGNKEQPINGAAGS